jgi:hypothetical protein
MTTDELLMQLLEETRKQGLALASLQQEIKQLNRLPALLEEHATLKFQVKILWSGFVGTILLIIHALLDSLQGK